MLCYLSILKLKISFQIFDNHRANFLKLQVKNLKIKTTQPETSNIYYLTLP